MTDINEQFQFPWQLTCKLAVEALIAGRTFEQQVNFGIKHGMVVHEEKRARYIAMRKANKAHDEKQ